MNKVAVTILVAAIILVTGVVSAIDFTGWEEIEIDDSLLNSTSTTVYTVMVPPDMTYSTTDTEIGPITILNNKTNQNQTVSITIVNNSIGKQFTNETALNYITNFMAGAGIIPLPGLEPTIISNGIYNYGLQIDQASGVYIISNDEKVTILIGDYPTMDEAALGVEELALIASTINITPVE